MENFQFHFEILKKQKHSKFFFRTIHILELILEKTKMGLIQD